MTEWVECRPKQAQVLIIKAFTDEAVCVNLHPNQDWEYQYTDKTYQWVNVRKKGIFVHMPIEKFLIMFSMMKKQ